MYAFGLAWRSLYHNRLRTLIAMSWVGFAVLLLFLQLGFYGVVQRTATLLFDHLRSDLAITSSEYQDLTRTRNFPRTRLAQALPVPGVVAVTPLTIGQGQWRNPNLPHRWWSRRAAEPGSSSGIFMIGVPPEELGRVFRSGQPNRAFASLRDAEIAGHRLARLDTVLLDRRSRSEFGGYDFFRTRSLSDTGPRLNQRAVEVVGEFEVGTGFSWAGMLITSEATFARATYQQTDQVTLGLIQLESGTDPLSAKVALQATLPPDVQVFTLNELGEIELAYWREGNSVGKLLWASVLLAVTVGGIFLYQMMAADVRNRLAEFATAKALGYQSADLQAIVLWQAVLLAALGFLPGLAATAVMYEVLRERAGLPMSGSIHDILLVLGLAVGMCVGSGLIAVRKVSTVDPATLF